MTKDQREAYVRQLCKDKNYDAAKTEKVVAAAHAQAAADDDGLFDALIELPIKSSADYNQKVDDLKKKAGALETWHTTAQATLTTADKERKSAEARIKKFEAKYGQLEDDDDGDDAGDKRDKRGKKPNADEIKQLQADIAARDQNYLVMMADAGDVIAKHAKMFKGEIISTRELLMEVGKAANDTSLPDDQRNITMEQAYLRLYGPKVKEAQENEVKAHEQSLIDKGAKAERERLGRSTMRSGASIPEQGPDSIVFNALDSDGKKDDATRALTEQDRLNLFAQDLGKEMAAREQTDAT